MTKTHGKYCQCCNHKIQFKCKNSKYCRNCESNIYKIKRKYLNRYYYRILRLNKRVINELELIDLELFHSNQIFRMPKQDIIYKVIEILKRRL